MEIRLLERDNDKGKLSFLIKDTNPAFVNFLRNVITSKVPTLAIENVEFRKNNTVLYDEIIAHRIGLIPIKTDLNSYELPEECSCKGKGCAKCGLKMTLMANSPGIVYSAKLKSKDPKAVPVSENIPIVKLLKGQALQLEATAVLGRGEVHAKWSPGLAYYKYKPIITILKEPKDPQKVVDSCPLKIFKIKDNKLLVDKDVLMKCSLCEACVETSNGDIKSEETDKEFVFYVESWGQLDCREIVINALDIFQRELDEFVKGFEKK